MGFYNKKILPRLLNFIMKSGEHDKCRASIIPETSGVVLEIGFGSGLNLPFYKNISKLIALEPSAELWNLSEERRKNAIFPIEFINSTAENIPINANSVDTAVATWTLCSVSGPKMVLNEIHRVLKNNGRLIFIEHGASPDSKTKKWQNRLNPLWKKVSGGCNLNREPDKLIEEAGFKISELEKRKKSFLDYQYKGIATK